MVSSDTLRPRLEADVTPPTPRTGSSWRAWAAVFVTVTLALLAGGFWFYRVEAEEIYQQQYQALAAIAELKSGQIQLWRNERLADADRLARGPFEGKAVAAFLREPGDRDNRADLRERLKVEHDEGLYHDVLLLAPDGHILLTTEAHPDPMNPATRRAIAAALASRKAVLSDLFKEPDGIVHIDAASAVRDSDGRPLAVVVLRSTAKTYLFPLVQSWPGPSRSAETLLVQREGEEVVYLNDLRHRSRISAGSLRFPLTRTNRPAVQAVLGTRGMFRGRDYRDVEVLASLRPVGDSPWLMVAKVDCEEILVEARYRAGVIVVIVGSLILLAAVTTEYGYKRRAARVLRISQQALRESDERLRLVFTSTNRGLYDLDVQTGACVVSPEYARMLGYDPADFSETRATWYERLHPDDREEVDRVNEECLAGRRQDYSIEFRQRTKGGDWKWIKSVGKLVSRSVDGRPMRMVGTHSDITERKLAELSLAESEYRYRDLVEHSQDLICTHALNGKLISVNEAACQLTGYSREALLQMNMADLLVPQARHLFSGYLTEIQATGQADGVLRIQTASGDTRTWEYHNTLRTEGVTVPVVRGMSRDITERTRAESELEKRNVFVETLLEHAPIGFAVNTIHDGRLVFVSRTFENICGVPPDSIHSVAELFEKVYLDPVFREQIRERIMADTATGDVARMRWENIPITTQAGEHKTVTATNIPLLHQNLMISTVQDVTERWQAEAALRESVERFQLANRATFNVIWDYNPRTNALWWNDNVEQIFGYRADEFEPRLESFSSHIHPEDLERVTAGFHAALHSGRELWSDEFRFRRKDGSYADVEDRGYIARDADGRAVRLLGAMQDITGQRRAEESIRVQAHMLDNIGQAVIATDTEGTITYANRFAAALYGWSSTDMLGLNALGVLVPQGKLEQAEQIVGRLQHGDNWSGESLLQTRDGRVFPASVAATPLLDKSGKLVGIIGVATDITDRKQLEAQFLQAQKMESVGRLAGGIAHDFNNLLTVINGTAELASMGLRAGDPLRNDLLNIQEAGERAASLTQQLLAFSRKQIMRQDVLHLGTLVEELRGMLRRLLEEAIDLVVVPATDVGRVRADPRQLEQVIMNLVVNAADAMPAGGTLTIETEDVELDEAFAAEHPSVQPGPHVMLAVSDTGIGMDEATRLRIFEPFFTTKDPGKGTGLGLATVYGIVKQSGGSIWVYSEVGRGTTFKIYLPRVDEVADADQPAQAVGAVHGTETILVVEDEEGLRHVAEGMLRWAGYTVLTASNGGEALLWLERHDGPVHLMLIDVVMPGIGGRELAARLTKARPDIKVLYMSGYTDDAILRHGVLDSTTHFVAKPYTLQELTRKVREVLDTPAPPATTAVSGPAR